MDAPKIGDWITVFDPIYKSISQGIIRKIEGGKIFFFDCNAFDGFGAIYETNLSNPMMKVRN